jgi:diguanylate cyclase (GGDEF)-like protein
LTQTIDGLLAPGGAGETAFAILIVDLERFKDINDTLGHDVGDTLLRDTAARLRTLLPTGDHVARLAGDQFCILAPGAGDAAGAEALARHVIQSIETPFRLNEIAIDIGATVGIARYPGDGTDAATLLRCADIALHATKHDGSGIGFYDGAQDKTSVRHLGFTSDLRRAIAGPEMMLAFQPKIDLRSGHVCGAEALVRWRHPDRGFIPPDQFIAHAEVTGLIHPLTYRILGQGVETLSQLHRCGRHLRMSLNLSAKNLYDGNLPDALLALVREARADPAFIVLEITESAMMHDPDRAVATANRLRSSGFGLSIDDYGTGFSSLAYLKRLPVQELKIDRSFVMDMHTDSTDAQIVKSTIAMAHDLDLRVVAEGIELSTHVDMLSTLGCDEGQGYFFSRPLLLADFQTWLSDRERTLTAA